MCGLIYKNNVNAIIFAYVGTKSSSICTVAAHIIIYRRFYVSYGIMIIAKFYPSCQPES